MRLLLALALLAVSTVACQRERSGTKWIDSEALEADATAPGFTEHDVALHGHRKLSMRQYFVAALEHPDKPQKTDTHQEPGCDVVSYEVEEPGPVTICVASPDVPLKVRLLTDFKLPVAEVSAGEPCKTIELQRGIYHKELCRDRANEATTLTVFVRPLADAPQDLSLAEPSKAGWYVEGGTCRQCNMPGAYFSGQSLRGAVFEDATLTHADFSYADLTGARFVSTNADHADFIHATMERVEFKETKLNHANLAGANLKRAWFRGQVVVGGAPTEAQFSNFYGANLYGATFEDSLMKYAVLQGADVANVVMGANVHWDFAVWSRGEVFTHDFQCPVGAIAQVGSMYSTNGREKHDAPHACATSTNNLLNLVEPDYVPARGVELYAGTSWGNEGTHFSEGSYLEKDLLDSYVGLATRSARVQPGCRVVGYLGDNFTGRTIVLTGDHNVDYFDQYDMRGGIHSMKVECPGLERAKRGAGLQGSPALSLDAWDDIKSGFDSVEDFFSDPAAAAQHVVDEARAAISVSISTLSNEALGTYRDPAGRLRNPLLYLDRVSVPGYGAIDLPAVPRPPYVPEEYWPIPLPFFFPFPEWAPFGEFGGSTLCDYAGSIVASQATRNTDGNFRPMATCGADVRSSNGYFFFGRHYPGPPLPGTGNDRFFRYTIWQDGRFSPTCKATSRNFNVNLKSFELPSIDDFWDVAASFPNLPSFGFPSFDVFKVEIGKFFSIYGFDRRFAFSMAYGVREDRFSLYVNVEDELKDAVQASGFPEVVAEAVRRATGREVRVLYGATISDNWESESGPVVFAACPSGQVVFSYLFGNASVDYAE